MTMFGSSLSGVENPNIWFIKLSVPVNRGDHSQRGVCLGSLVTPVTLTA